MMLKCKHILCTLALVFCRAIRKRVQENVFVLLCQEMAVPQHSVLSKIGKENDFEIMSYRLHVMEHNIAIWSERL